MKILLIGNPNVGKSVLFSRLTGVRVIASNYPGTTIGFTKGYLKWDSGQAEIIDVPGTYSLEPTNRAEEVALDMLQEGDIVINVVDATNLERNLYLTLQLLERKIPLIIALNLWDDAQHIAELLQQNASQAEPVVHLDIPFSYFLSVLDTLNRNELVILHKRIEERLAV